MTNTQTFPRADAADTGTADTSDTFDIVTDALTAKGCLPCQRPVLGLPNGFDHCDVTDFYLEPHPGGWVANIAFGDVPAGRPNTLGTPDATPFPSKQEAFLAGAMLLCLILTGSERLPFFVAGKELIVAGYGTGGFSGPFIMTKPLPWT